MPFFGLYSPFFSYPGIGSEKLFDHLATIATAAELSGFDAFLVMDHFEQAPSYGPRTAPVLEAYTLLGALAAHTDRIKLGALVTGVTYRNPALLAKIVTTLDVISRGRAICGLGAAWYESEHHAYGYSFPPVKERMDRLEEALQICRAMFQSASSSFTGTYYRLDEAMNVPQPIQPGGPPVWVGGAGERRTLRLAAQYADVCDLPLVDLDGARHKLDVLRRHCEGVDRDPASILKMRQGPVMLVASRAEAERRMESAIAAMTIAYPSLDPDVMRRGVIAGSLEDIVEQVGTYLDTGLDGMTIVLRESHDPDTISLIGNALRSAFGSSGAVA